ncbi:hypothetical protein [Demequina globuliformis]|uniref:hypothetical protein n=1 Tax=Demequina globuliformis TaxID=676202 RepID=UPI000782A795|nr:hypothetical protein [Demequina globuliformis]
MPLVSDRVRERLVDQFGASSTRMVSALERLPVPGQVDPERVHAAVVIASRAHQGLFEDAMEHAADDWRDLLERAGLDRADWRDNVLETFGPE